MKSAEKVKVVKLDSPLDKLINELVRLAKSDSPDVQKAVGVRIEKNRKLKKDDLNEGLDRVAQLTDPNLIKRLAEKIRYDLKAEDDRRRMIQAEKRSETLMQLFWQEVGEIHELDEDLGYSINEPTMDIVTFRPEDYTLDEIYNLLQSNNGPLELMRYASYYGLGTIVGDLAMFLMLQGDVSLVDYLRSFMPEPDEKPKRIKFTALIKRILETSDEDFLIEVASEKALPGPVRNFATFIYDYLKKYNGEENG
jgi:hypothetical protein